MANTLTSTDLLRLLETAQDYLLDSTIGFVRAYQVRESKKPGPDDFVADLGGCGTLVSAAGIRAIVTADHVLKTLPESFGLIVLTRIERQCRRMIVEGARRITVARGLDPARGPDLGLLVLSPIDATKL